MDETFKGQGRATRLVSFIRHLALLIPLFVVLPLLFSQQAQKLALLSGLVCDSSGKGIAGARVTLHSPPGTQEISVTTDADGKYHFAGLLPGAYKLTATAPGFGESQVSKLALGSEAKSVDLTLTPSKLAQPTAMQPQFSDEPAFTVAGVKDNTNLGGHGSDTIAHARNNLAKETASLGKAGSEPASDLRETAKSLRDKLDREPNNPEAHHRLGEVDEQLADPLEAVRQYQRAAELNPTEAYLFDWGAELLLHHAPEPAIEVFSKGTRQFPKSARMLLGLGAAHFGLGSNDQAVKEICAASDLNPGDTASYLFLGKILRTEKIIPSEAVEKLHRFVMAQPQNAEASYYYAVALLKQAHNVPDKERDLEIESLLKRAVQVDQKFAAAYLQLGIVYSERHDNRQAVSMFELAAQADPRMEEPHYRLAQVYRQLGEGDKSKGELQVYEQLSKESEQQAERERHEIRQFVYTLRDQPPAGKH